MRIALLGPIYPSQLADWVDDPAGMQVLPDDRGGTPTTQLAVALLRAGTELTIITLLRGIAEPLTFQGSHLRVRIAPKRSGGRGRDVYAAERAHLRRILTEEAPDVAHAQWSYEYALGALGVVPTLVTFRDWAPTILRYSPDPYRVVRLGMAAAVLRRATHTTVTSPYMRDLVARWGRRPPALVPNALAEEAFTTAEEVLPRLDRPRILTINNGFGRRKNVETLLQAFPVIRARHPGAELHLVGQDFGVGGAAQAWAGAQGLTGGCTFHGPVPATRVRELLGASELLVHPSLEESFGMVLLEAMAQRVPVVAGERSGAVPWVLAGGRAGVLTDITQPSGIAAAAGQLLADERRWHAMSEAGYRRAGDFRISAVSALYLQLYDLVRRGEPIAGVVSLPGEE